jgi:oligopeptide/dipeptide ABC transporter ATP-binding protein
MSALVSVEELTVELPVDGAPAPILRGVSFELAPREVLGLVGESGSGKSMTARALIGLLPRGAQSGGRISFDGRDVRALRGAEERAYRAQDVAMVFQDPRAHVNPVRRIGDFLCEALVAVRRVPRAEAERRAVAVLEEVGIDEPERRLRQYPHELSGGMLQRVLIASTLLVEPRLMLADEPTTALDVTAQASVIGLLDRLRRRRDMAMLFITHDLELAAAICDRIAVMYAGTIVEVQPAAALRDAPRHPYTAGLLSSRPRIDARVERMPQLTGRPLSAAEAPAGCAFQDRCPHRVDRCGAEVPAARSVTGMAGVVACHRAEELSLSGSLAS